MKLTSRYDIDRDKKHNYTVSRKSGEGGVHCLPGVTGILSVVGSEQKLNAMMGWAKKMALTKACDHIREKIGQSFPITEEWVKEVYKSAWKKDRDVLENAGDIGDKVHKAIDAYILGEKPILDEKSKPGFDNFLGWLSKSGIKLLYGDTYVASLEYGFGGAMDSLGIQDGAIVLPDWKTSNAIRDTYPLQVGAYVIAAEESLMLGGYPLEISKAYVVRFGKDIPGDVEPREVNIPEAKKAFLAALELRNRMEDKLWN